MYIKRHLETTIEKLSGCCKVLLVTGPRQPKPLLLVICLSRSFPSSIAFDMFGK